MVPTRFDPSEAVLTTVNWFISEKKFLLYAICIWRQNLTSDWLSQLPWVSVTNVHQKTVCRPSYCGKLSPMLNPFGCNVPNLVIQKSSRLRSKFVISSLLMLVFVIFSMMVNFASLSKLWPGCKKWVSTASLSVFWHLIDVHSSLSLLEVRFSQHRLCPYIWCIPADK